MLKKIAAATALVCAAGVAQADYIAWAFWGKAENTDSLAVVPFYAWIGFDTQHLRPSGEVSYPAQEVVSFHSNVCGGGDGGGLYTGQNSLTLSGWYSNNDCFLLINVSGAGIGEAGPFNSVYDAMDRAYNLSRPGVDVTYAIDFGNGTTNYRATEVTFAMQSIPEPSPIVLIGAGLAGLMFVRRRRDTRELA